MPGLAAKASEVRVESFTFSHLETSLQVDCSSAAAMDIDDSDGSDLTSLEDEDEQMDAVTHNLDEVGSSESPLTEESSGEEQNGIAGPSSNGAPQPLLPSQMSPSRIGSAIARPTPLARLKTYGGRKSGSRFRAKDPQKPKPPMSPIPNDMSSPSTSLTHTLARKRRVSVSAPQLPSPPTKSTKRRKGEKINDEPVLRRKPGPKPKVITISSSPLPETAPVSKSKGKGKQAAHREAPASSPVPLGRIHRSASPGSKDTWSLETLGTFVWVRLDRRGAIVENDAIEYFWWPAKVELYPSGKGGIRVLVFSPPTIPTASSHIIEVERPSGSNIISYQAKDFTTATFYSLASSSSQSRPYGFDKIKSRWEAAYKEIKSEDIIAHDGFPSSIAGLFSQSLDSDSELGDENASKGSPRHTLTTLPPSKTAEGEPWSPPLPDNNVSVPGEHVLSTLKVKKFRGKYYPAKVVGYLPPDGPAKPPLYTVHFMDNFRENVTRDMFYIYEEDEFGTCTLGAYKSYESFHEAEGEDDLDDEFLMSIGNRVTFPAPQLPTPVPAAFCALPMLEQTAYIIPVLTKIIKNSYKPAEERISAFMQGGRKRANMLKDAPQKGTLTRRELRELAEIIKHFTEEFDSPIVKAQDDISITEVETSLPPKRETRPQQASIMTLGEPSNEQQSLTHLTNMDESNPLPPPSLPPSSTAEASTASTPKVDSDDDSRPTVPASANGQQPFSEDLHHRTPQNCIQSTTNAQQSFTTFSFFDLSGPEKIQFATDVLLREAIVQILLWRTGKRTTTNTLSDTEEDELRDIGLNLASIIDIAHTVNDLREKKVKSQQPAKTVSNSQVSGSGTRSRPKNV